MPCEQVSKCVFLGKKGIAIKRSWCLLSSEDINTKAASRIETTSKANTYSTVDETAAASASFLLPPTPVDTLSS